MRKLLAVLAVSTAAVMGFAGTADAFPVGPTGSTWVNGEVTCGYAPDSFLLTPVNAYNGARGLEVCADGGLGPIQLRAFLAAKDYSGVSLPDYIQVDGDNDFLATGQAHIELPF